MCPICFIYSQDENFTIEMIIPSASSKKFHLINFHIWVWSKISEYIQKYWTLSKNFEHDQNIFFNAKFHTLIKAYAVKGDTAC